MSSNTPHQGGNYYGLSPEQATREFDALRREATRLERTLEDRVARYGQVGLAWVILDYMN
jgi:Golgi SNAP receptor complex protein 1